MANNLYRLSGGLGLEEPIIPGDQVMLQGIGFPLRPVDNVIPEGAPDLDDIVAKGIFVSWMGNWEQGLIYPKGAQVRDGTFIMLSNTQTFERAAPQPDGVASFGLPAYAPEAIDPSNVSSIECGHTYTFTDEGWIKQLRVWVPALSTSDVGYRIIIIENPVVGEATTVTITPLISAVDEWVILTFLNSSVQVGDQITITLESLNSAADTVVNGEWIFQGFTQIGAPQFQSWTVNNQRTTLRINKFDADGTDRSTDLESVLPETLITMFETGAPTLTATYRVSNVLDQGAYMDYAVVLINEAGGGPRPFADTDITFTIPIPLATEYAEELAVWPTGNPAWATVQSFLFYGETNQNVLDSAFGVDMEFQPADVSADWDIIVSE